MRETKGGFYEPDKGRFYRVRVTSGFPDRNMHFGGTKRAGQLWIWNEYRRSLQLLRIEFSEFYRLVLY